MTLCSRKSHSLTPCIATFGPRLPSAFEAKSSVCLPPHLLSRWYPVNARLWPLLSKSSCWVSVPWARAPQPVFTGQDVLRWLSQCYSVAWSTFFYHFCHICWLYCVSQVHLAIVHYRNEWTNLTSWKKIISWGKRKLQWLILYLCLFLL